MGYRITQVPSPNFWQARSNQPIIAIVHHRMAGFLPGTDTRFKNPSNQVSAHFGIGYRSLNGPVEISQYVDLSDTAWANGNYDPSGGWTLYNGKNPNYSTVSIEHEDGGPSGTGVVSEPILIASLWLVSLLLTGDPVVIRGAGIKMRENYTADQLKDIIPDTETLIDHNRISGIKKPYCWRPWLQDTQAFIPGWQPRLLQALRGMNMTIEEILQLLNQKIDELKAEIVAANKERDDALLKLSADKLDADAILTAASKIKTR